MKPILSLSKISTCVFAGIGLCVVASADDYAWVNDLSHQFFSVDLNTGGATFIGDTSSLLSGLGGVGSSVYGMGDPVPQLYLVNTSTAALTAIGTTGLPAGSRIGGFGSTTSGLYGIDYLGDLVQFNPITGAATVVGNIGLDYFGSSWNLSSGGSNLYLAWMSGNTEELGEINTSTGSLTMLGGITTPNPTPGIDAMEFAGGVLYSFGYFDSEIDSVNVGSLQASYVSTAPAVVSVYGMTPEVVPEPVSVVVLLGGVTTLLRRRR